MAQTEFLCELPERSSGEVYTAYYRMVFCPRCFDLTFSIGKTVGGSSSLVQQLVIDGVRHICLCELDKTV